MPLRGAFGATRRYLFGFVAAGILAAVGALVLLDHYFSERIQIERIHIGTALAGELRTAVAEAGWLASARPEGRAAADAAFRKTRTRLEARYRTLIDEAGPAAGTLSDEGLALFFQPPFALDSGMRGILAQFDSFAAAAPDARVPLLDSLAAAAAGQADTLTRLVALSTEEHEAGTRRLLWYSAVLFAAIAALILFGVFGIVRPALRTSRRIRNRISSAQVQAERGRARFTQALDGFDDGVAIFDAGGRLIYANDSFRGAYETDDDPLLPGTAFDEFVRTLARRGALRGIDDTDAWVARQLERRGEASGRTTWTLADGRLLEVAHHRTAGGETVFVQADVTEHGRRDAARTATEIRARAMLDSVFDGVLTVTPDGMIESANRRAELIFGRAGVELEGQNLSALIADSEFKSMLEAVRGGGEGEVREVAGRRGDGRLFPLEVALSPLEDTWSLDDRRRARRTSYIATLRDISRQKELAAQLQQAQKMEAIGTLAGGIAHDFNNILSIILGYGSLLQEQSGEGESGENVAMVMQAAARARDLVEQILTFSRRSEPELAPLDPRPVVKEVLKLMRASLPATIDIRRDIAAGPDLVMADPSQLHQVMMNLCTNSAQAMSDAGGVLSVALRKGDGEGRPPELAGNEYLRISVSDTGHGMDEATTARIFEPFFTTKERGQGTGLGLAVVHGIISESGGAIEVSSVPGKGTTFDVFLPLTAEVPAAVPSPEQAVPRGRGRILFVDDEIPIVRMGQKILGRLGYTVVGATEGAEALDAFRSEPGAFDLLVTDQTMPGMTGDNLIAEVRRIRHDIPVILCTGYSNKVDEARAREMGVDVFLNKPLESATLGWSVARALGTAS